MKKRRGEAIVIGGSIAGLFVARVLSEFFEKVTILENDKMDGEPGPRKGAPQGRHTHVLLGRGAQLLSELFPGIISELKEGGSSLADVGNGYRFHHYGSWKVPVELGVPLLMQTRPFLEQCVQKRVGAIKNICFEQGWVTGLMLSEDKKAIAGVMLGTQRRSADFIVDASGRGTRAPSWLESLGFGAVSIEQIKFNLGYSHRFFSREEGERNTMPTLIAPTPPKETRAAAWVPVEGNRWSLLLGGSQGDYPPDNEMEFEEFARGYPVSDVHNFITSHRPIGPIQTYRIPTSIRKYFERLRPTPERFVAIGDAVASFNPLYGQGMAVAIMEAALVGTVLDGAGDNLDGVSAVLQKKIGKTVDAPWLISGCEDLRWPQTDGSRPLSVRILNAYVERIHRLSGRDGEVTKAFFRVQNLIDPPTSLFRPAVLSKVLFRRG